MNTGSYLLSPQYTLRRIEKVPYLLPYGQGIANFHPGIRLNETSFLLLSALRRKASARELYQLLQKEYAPAAPSEQDQLMKDIQDFLSQMLAEGFIEPYSARVLPVKASCNDHCFAIGPLTLFLQLPKELIHPYFQDFSCPAGQTADLTVSYCNSFSGLPDTGKMLIHTRELALLESENYYIFCFADSIRIPKMYVSIDGRECLLCLPPQKRNAKEDLKESIFHALRFAFLVCAQAKGLFAIHSASILYREGAWLFSGPSGTGKSTHTGLWKKVFGVPDLNGDLNLLGEEKGQLYVYGLPWCGTSATYTAKTYPLGGIVLLKQGPDDRLLPLPVEEEILRVADRFISPSWTKDLLFKNLDFAENLRAKIPVFYLQCTRNRSAAIYMKEQIDSYYLKSGRQASCRDTEP